MMKAVLHLVLLLAVSAQANRAKDLIALIADVIHTSPSDNEFIQMIQNGELDYMMSGMIAQFSEIWSGEFITTKGTCVQKSPSEVSIGKRSMDQSSVERRAANIPTSELLKFLQSADGQKIINTGAAGGYLDVPPPKFASGGVIMGSLPVAGRHTGIRGKRAMTSAAALMKKVRDIIINDVSKKMFLEAVDDYTVRVALYNVCNCNPFAKFIRWYAKFFQG